MAEKHTDKKLYRVIRKDGSHLNIKVNPDSTKSALQFTDDNNDLNGSVDLLEVDEVFILVIGDATTQLLEYGTEKAEIWVEKKAVPVAKSQIVHICNKGF